MLRTSYSKKRLSTNEQSFPSSQTSHVFTALATSIEGLTEQIQSLGHQLAEIKQQRRGDTDHKFHSDERFENLNVPIPNLREMDDIGRAKEIEKALGIACHKIYSAGFGLLKNQVLDDVKTKVYCSEQMILWLIETAQKNSLTSKEFEIINKCLKYKVLPYFGAKYPQSEQLGVNVNLASLIIPQNNRCEQENDLVSRSGIRFRYKQSQNYSSEVMKFLNFIVESSNQKDNYQDYLVEASAKEKFEYTSLYKQFEKDMSRIFEKVEDQTEVLEMLSYNPTKRQSTTAILRNILTLDKEKREKYRKDVKSYTQFRVGKKLPDTIKKFNERQISNGVFSLSDPAVMRIVTKWCEELETLYEENSILNREVPFLMRDGNSRYMEKKWILVLCELLQKYKKQFPEKYVNGVKENTHQYQSEYANQAQDEFLMSFRSSETLVGKFATIMLLNCEAYLKGYLNSLIHGICMALKDFDQIMKHKKEMQIVVHRFCQSEIDIDSFMALAYEKCPFHESIDEQIPELITFKLGDLLRCKCSSKEEEIRALYCQLEKISKSQGKFLKIMRVKNRLQQGTKDILLNILYRETIVVEVQLAIKGNRSKFIEKSSSFGHYLYELERAQFGPINEMCTIWMTKDLRANFYKTHVKYQNRRRDSGLSEPCKHVKKQAISFPFKCSTCSFLYTDLEAQNLHYKCSDCDKKICRMCLFEQKNTVPKDCKVPIKDIKQLVYYRPEKGNYQTQIIKYSFTLQVIPDRGYIFNLKGAVKQWIRFVKYRRKNKVMLLAHSNNEKYTLIQSFEQIELKDDRTFMYEVPSDLMRIISQQLKLRNLLMNNVMIKENEQKAIDQIPIKQNYEIPLYLSSAQTAQKSSMNIFGQGISEKVFKNVSNRPGKDCFYVKRMNLAENAFTDISVITNQFSDLLVINLQQNRISQIPLSVGNWKYTLKHLDLSKNKLQGLPKEFAGLLELRNLNLSENDFCCFPAELCQVRSLQVLIFDCNRLKQISREINNLQNLEILSVENNQLTEVCNEMCQLQNMVNISLSNNRIKSLNRDIGKFKKLCRFEISENRLNSLSQELCQLYYLQYLNIRSNNVAKLPENIGNLTSLQKFQCTSNCLQQLPSSFWNLSNLKELYLSFNGIKTLEIPEENHLNLEMVNFADNQFTEFPSSLCYIRSLKSLSIQNNKMLKISSLINQLTELMHINASSNLLQSIPSQISLLKNLKYVFLQDNKIETLPDNIGQLSHLELLLLKGNNLRDLPESFFILKINQLSLDANPLSPIAKQKLRQMLTRDKQ